MSIGTYREPSVEVQQPAWIDALWGQLASVASDDAVEALYARMNVEYGNLHFGPKLKRSPLKEIHPV